LSSLYGCPTGGKKKRGKSRCSSSRGKKEKRKGCLKDMQSIFRRLIEGRDARSWARGGEKKRIPSKELVVGYRWWPKERQGRAGVRAVPKRGGGGKKKRNQRRWGRGLPRVGVRKKKGKRTKGPTCPNWERGKKELNRRVDPL